MGLVVREREFNHGPIHDQALLSGQLIQKGDTIPKKNISKFT